MIQRKVGFNNQSLICCIILARDEGVDTLNIQGEVWFYLISFYYQPAGSYYVNPDSFKFGAELAPLQELPEVPGRIHVCLHLLPLVVQLLRVQHVFLVDLRHALVILRELLVSFLLILGKRILHITRLFIAAIERPVVFKPSLLDSINANKELLPLNPFFDQQKTVRCLTFSCLPKSDIPENQPKPISDNGSALSINVSGHHATILLSVVDECLYLDLGSESLEIIQIRIAFKVLVILHHISQSTRVYINSNLFIH